MDGQTGKDKKMIQQQIDYLTNSIAISGANVPDGVRQGNFNLYGLPNAGVPTGLVHSYNSGLKASVTIATVTMPIGGQNKTYTLSLADNLVPGSTQITNLQNNVTALQLDAPRALALTSSINLNLTVNVSGFDRFYAPISFSRSITGLAGLPILIDSGIYLITNIEIIPTQVLGSAVTVTIQTSSFAELLFTDYAFSGNLITATSGTAIINPLTAGKESVTVPTDVVLYVLYPYLPATWDGLVTNIAGRPRPLLSLNVSDQTILLASDASQIVTQIVYGFNDTQFTLSSFLNTPVPLKNVFTGGVYPGDDVPIFTPSVQSVFGRTNSTLNWKGWAA